MEVLQTLAGFSTRLFGPEWGPPIWITVKTLVFIIVIALPVILTVAYLTLAERKVIGYMQVRIGPNRVGPYGLLQPFADVLKLLVKEIVVPSGANKFLFVLAPMLSLMPALAAWAVVPFAPDVVLADVNAGLLYIMAITSMGVYGVIIAGWASNSKYSFLGAMRSAAQIVSYEIAMGFALVCVLMVSQSLNLSDIVNQQARGRFAAEGLNLLSWNWLPLLPMFLVYFISGVAETNRSPFEGYPGVGDTFLGQPSLFWLVAKIAFFLFCFLWFRATFPRYRYDQIMRLGWKVFIPVTLVWLCVEAVLWIYKVGPFAA